ncbi:MAG: response regulator [Kiritimatiellales bacterium]|nr:response regulator [Kiritimatiellales bacterium]
MPKNKDTKDVLAEGEKEPKKAAAEMQESEVGKVSDDIKESKETKEKNEEGEEVKEEAPAEKSSGKKECLLIAEDEKPLAHALELKFSHEGYETHIVEDGAAALEKVKEFKPKAILLDLIMPKMDGFAFLEALKKDNINIPVIVLSNLGQDEDQERAKALGVKGYFVKSNTPIVEIVKHVKSVL